MGSRNNKPGRIVKGTALQPSLKSASGVWSLDEAMQAHRANAWPQPNLFQPVANSLRMSLAKASYLTKSSPARDGSLMAGTISFWMKPSTFYGLTATSAYQLYQTAYVSANNWRSLISSTGADYSQLYFAGYNGSGTLAAEIYPTWGLKDTNAWYHIMLSFDTTQPTAANRFRMYVNGVQITTFSSATYPAQNTQLGFFKSGLDRYLIGINRGLANPYYDGYLAELNAVDGYGLQPSMFGKFDTNNTWVPVPYTGTYGTNGFYLPFTNATSSQTLGYDASLTGTTTYDVDQDPYRGHVALHLTGNGPAGGNNNVFADSSSTNNAISRTGNITQGSFSPYPLNSNAPYNPAINGASAYFPKSGWLSAPTAAVSSLGTGDFTFESWVYPINFTTTSLFQRWFSFGTGLASDVTVNIDTSGNLVFRINDAVQLTSATTLTANTWNHVAFVRSSGTVRFYINGVSGNSASVATNISTQGGNPIIIGAEPGQSQGSAGDFFGYMSNFRIIKGVAVYTANFTPTMRPFGTLTNNLLNFSEDFSNTNYWITPAASVAATITSNSAIAPDGTPSAFTVNYSVAGSTHPCFQNITFATANTSSCTASMYVKYSSGTTFALQNAFFNGAGVIQDGYGNITFTNGVALVAASSANMTVSSTDVGNGWYRIKVTATNNSGSASTYSRVSIGQSGIVGSIYVWGAQLETGSSMTNYTPTPANFSTAPSLLLNFANSAVVDTAGANNITTVGAATITSASKYGSGALAFSGSTSNYFLTNPGNQFEPGSQDFTVEFWWYPISTGRQWFYHATTDYWFAVDYSSVSTNQKMGMWASSNGSSWNMINSDGGGNGICNTVVPQNQWNHIAYTRNNTTFRLFLNGKLDGVVSASGSIVDRSSQAKFIGTWAGAGGGAPAVNGSIDDFRFTKGVARYTSDFSPPARALPEVGGKSFVTTNVNAGVAQRFVTVGTTSWTAPADVTSVEVLVVAAGGAGASDGATNVGNGGGGGGGVIYNSAYPVTPGQTYTVTVGAGQVGLFAGNQRSGGNSVFGNLVAIGGGGGGYYINNPGATGGSGGGGAATSAAGGGGTAGQGFAGGSGASNNGGAGGGAGGPASGSNNRDGGVGLQFGISGTPTFYAGGGGGSASSGAQGTGGSGGGGAAVSGGAGGIDGTANTGGGGGAQNNGGTKGGNGGSGIVVVRYTTAAVGNSSDATTDNLVDSPTQYGHDMGQGGEVVGNYATWNPLLGANNQAGGGSTFASSIVALSNGNLNASNPTAGGQAPRMQVHSNIGMPSGKWYAEFTGLSGRGAGISLGDYVAPAGAGSGVSHSMLMSPTSGAVSVGNGASATVTGTAVAISATDVLGVAFDADNRVCYYYRNGVLTQTASNITTTSGTPYFASNSWFFSSSPESSGAPSAITANFGQRAWAYTPPAGFNALTTKNFARLTAGTPAANPNQYFDAVLYTGTGAAQTITMPGGFTPDFVWIKRRNSANSHLLADIVRGNTKVLLSNDTGAELTDASYTTFVSGGFSVSGNGNEINNSSAPYVAWCWKANGAAVANTSGTITSQVSANTASGFSVVTFTGTTSNVSVGHGLGITPKVFIVKSRSSGNWWYYTTQIDGTLDYLALNLPDGAGNASQSLPTSTVFYQNQGDASVAYCFAEIPGFSKFGTYVGNASTTDGAFIYCGFRPRFVMIKDSTNAATQWHMMDSARNAFNPVDARLMANLANAENAQSLVDFTSTGFKIRDPNGVINTSAANLIYMAFAEKPFGNVNGTAR